MNDKELREKTKHRTFTSMAARRRWLALHEQIERERDEKKITTGNNAETTEQHNDNQSRESLNRPSGQHASGT